MMDTPAMRREASGRGFAVLRNLARRTEQVVPREHCEICNAILAPQHQHLIELSSRKLVCACDACSLLFDSPENLRFRRIPRDTYAIRNFQLSEVEWDELLIPINVAFLFESSLAGRTIANYPSPAGATESLLTLEAWQGIVAKNQVLDSMAPDVQALLVNRLGAQRGFPEPQYYLAPIDECYKLVGLVRSHWRGLSGGTEVWQQISEYFSQLAKRSSIVSSSEVRNA